MLIYVELEVFVKEDNENRLDCFDAGSAHQLEGEVRDDLSTDVPAKSVLFPALSMLKLTA